MSSRGPYRRHSAQFKLQLCQDIRSAVLGRRDAQKKYSLSANLIQLWLTQFNHGAEVAAVVGERPRAGHLQALNAVALAESDHALRGAQPFGDVIAQQPGAQLGTARADRHRLRDAPCSAGWPRACKAGRSTSAPFTLVGALTHQFCYRS